MSSWRGVFQRLYERFPIPLQNAAFTVLGYRLRRARYGRGFREKLAWLRESEWWDAARIREHQATELRRLIAHAYDTVPFYRRTMDEKGVKPSDVRSPEDLAKLPVISKGDIRACPEDFLSRAFAGRRLTANLTSGTTGTALRFLLSDEALQFQWAVWWRHKARFGLRLGDPFVMFGARVPIPASQKTPPFWRRNAAINQTYLSTYHFTPQYMDAIVDFLNHSDFDFYTGYPSAMVVLARYMRDHDLRLTNRPKYVVTGSEALLPPFEALLREQWGVPVTEQYGMAEACCNMARCECGRYHEDFEFGVIETLDNPADPAGPKRIVATGFANYAMPLIRYDVGDLGEFTDVKCACGRQSRVALRIDGRTEDYVRTPDGRMAVGMNQVFEWAPGAQEMQIVQNELASITVRVVRRPSWSASDEEAILRELRNRVGDELVVKLEFVEEIPRSASGKFRAVVSSLGREGSAEERALTDAVETGMGH